MGLAAYPLASPLPTAPPSPRDVGRRLFLARRDEVETCAWVDGDFDDPVTCNIGQVCYSYDDNVIANQFCCESDSYASGSCGHGPTDCLDSTAVDCSFDCTTDSDTATCTDEGASYCLSVTYSFSGGLAGWRCGPTRGATITAFDTYLGESAASSSVAPVIHISSHSDTTQPSSAAPSSTVTAPTSSSSLVNPVITPIISSPTPTPSSSGLSTGAKAGIAVGAIGAVAIIAALVAFILFRRRSDRRHRQNLASGYNPNQPQMIQQQQQPQPPPQPPLVASPALTQQGHMSMASNPSATSSTPLTQANMRAMSHSPPPASEVLPSESASQIQSPIGGGSVLSSPASPTGFQQGSSHTGSQEHSGLGPMPIYPTGPSAFPHADHGAGQSVLSNPNTFLSSPPVHAPGIDHYSGGQT